MISKKLVKSSLVYSVIGALPLAWSIILLPFYTTLLTPDDFGRLALYASLALLLQTLMNLSLDSYVAVQYIELRNDPRSLRACLGTVTVTLLLWGGVFTGLFVIGGPGLFTLFFPEASLLFLPYGLMTVVTAFCNGFFKTYTVLLIYQERVTQFFWMNVLNFMLTILISITGLYLFPYTLIGPMWGRLLSGLCIFLAAFFFMVREFGLTFYTDYLKGMAQYCWPLIIYFGLFWILNNLDRFIINHYLTPEDVAIYDIAVKCTLLLEFLQIGLSNTIYPKVFALWQDAKNTSHSEQVNQYFHVISAITLLAIPLFVLLVPVFVPILVPNAVYYQAFDYLLLLGLGYAMRSLYFFYLGAFSFFKKTRQLLKPTFLSVVFQVTLSIILVKQWNLIGAVWANLLAKIVQVGFLSLWGKTLPPGRLNKMKMVVLPLAYVLTAILLHTWLPAGRWHSHLLLWMVLSLMVVRVYRREIGPLLTDLTQKSLQRIKALRQGH